MLERLKELETSQNFTEMLSELRKHESVSTQAYSQIRSLITNPTVAGILHALEEMSITSSSLLRHCTTLLEEEIIVVPLARETEVSHSIAAPIEISRERDDMFTLNSLERILREGLAVEVSEDDLTATARFWYIKEGKNESIEVTKSEKDTIGKILLNILNQIEVEKDEKFSISPLGYDPLLQHQFHNSFGHIVKTYGEEYTLIKLYS